MNPSTVNDKRKITVPGASTLEGAGRSSSRAVEFAVALVKRAIQ